MSKRAAVRAGWVGSLAVGIFAGCQNLPGGSNGPVVHRPADDPPVGTESTEKHPGVGAIVDGLLGAGGGYVIGAAPDKIADNRRDEARQASDRAVRSPARRDDAARARTADVNEDGFVTVDEVVALRQANLTDAEIIERLRATKQVFELTPQQQNLLRDRGVSDPVIAALPGLNRGPATRAGQ